VAQLFSLGVFERMKNINTLMLIMGSLWIFMAAPFLISLLPIGQRLVQRLELRLKPGARTVAEISRLRRVIFIFFCGLYAAVAFASAFQHSINSPVVVALMICLPGLYLLLGIWDKQFKSKHEPDA
jgi:hypothetical protein